MDSLNLFAPLLPRLWLGVLLWCISCATPPLPDESGKPFLGRQLWTATNLCLSRNQYISWHNHLEGRLLPLGTQIRLMEINSKYANFIDNGNQKYILYWRGEGSAYQPVFEQEFPKYFSEENPQPVLQKLSSDEKDAIEVGAVKKGMSKQAVLLSCGFPYNVSNPLQEDTWVYWVNSWKKLAVGFENGVVTEVWK